MKDMTGFRRFDQENGLNTETRTAAEQTRQSISHERNSYMHDATLGQRVLIAPPTHAE